MRNISVKRYEDSLAGVWDKFVQDDSRNGGIFHERRFLGYHAPDKFKDVSLLFYEKEELLGVFPAALVEKDGKSIVVSHPGSSNGGLIYRFDCTMEPILEILQLLIAFYKDLGVQSIEMKISEPIFNKFPDGELMYLLWHRGFTMTTQELSSCVLLTDNKSWEKLCRKRHLNYIRKLDREGVKANESADIEKVYQVIEKNLGSKYQKKPTHTLEELKKLKELYPDRIHFWAAEKGDVILGVIVVFTVNKVGVHDFYIARDEDAEDVNALAFLHHKAFEYYHQKGLTWFNFGISSRAEQIKWGILRFKERAGGRATTRQVWALNDVASYKAYQIESSYDLNEQKSKE